MPADRATGTLFSLCASFCASTGLVMQKHSHNMKEWEGNSFRWRWWLGLTFITLGGVFDSLALLNAPLIDIAPLTSVTVLLNALLSSFFLNEPVGIVEICSTLLIFIGSTVTCIFGAESKEVHNIWSLIDRFGRRSFTIYITVVVCVFCVASLVLWFSQRSLARSTQRKVEPLLYGILSAMVGGIQVVLLKCIAEIFHGQFGGQEDHFQHNAVWVLCAIFVGTAVAQLLILNIGLRNCDAVHLLPVYQAFLIIVGICGGERSL